MLLPLVGTLVSKVDARALIGFGFITLSASLFYMTSHLYQGIDFRTAVSLRCFQSVGLAFLFVPINTLTYTGVPPEKNNAVSGIVNLSRNMGGDVGIAFVTTFIARRSQTLSGHALGPHERRTTTPSGLSLKGISAAIEHTGVSAADAAHKATAALYGQLVQNATTLAYIDVLKVMAIVTAMMLPLLLLTQKPKPGGAPNGH